MNADGWMTGTRRRVALGVAVAVAAGTALLAGPLGQASAGREPVLPAGWRWESYGGVQVGVPKDWGWGNGTQRISQWCTTDPAERERPVVGRPGPVTLVACPGLGEGPRPQLLLRNTGTVVALDRSGQPDGVTHEGDGTIVRRDGVAVTVVAPPSLRRQIVETVRTAEVDGHGCSTRHALSARPDIRPAPSDVAALRAISAVSACRYAIARNGDGNDPRLISSLRLGATDAARAVEGIAAAPLGGGPDDPDQCLPSSSYGDEILLLRIHSGSGASEVVLRYDGCDHHGFDDGVNVRAATPAAVAPFTAGPNAG